MHSPRVPLPIVPNNLHPSNPLLSLLQALDLNMTPRALRSLASQAFCGGFSPVPPTHSGKHILAPLGGLPHLLTLRDANQRGSTLCDRDIQDDCKALLLDEYLHFQVDSRLHEVTNETDNRAR